MSSEIKAQEFARTEGEDTFCDAKIPKIDNSETTVSPDGKITVYIEMKADPDRICIFNAACAHCVVAANSKQIKDGYFDFPGDTVITDDFVLSTYLQPHKHKERVWVQPKNLSRVCARS